MPVSIIVEIPRDAKSLTESIDSFTKRLERIGCQKTGTVAIESLPFNGSQQRVVHIVHISDHPATCFACLESTGTVLVADSMFYLLMLKLKNYYPSNKHSRVKADGVVYEWGDFTIRIVTVVLPQQHTSSPKGALVEVQYNPASCLADCRIIYTEFLSGIGLSLDSLPQCVRTRAEQIYSIQDTILQYIEHFERLKKLP